MREEDALGTQNKGATTTFKANKSGAWINHKSATSAIKEGQKGEALLNLQETSNGGLRASNRERVGGVLG